LQALFVECGAFGKGRPRRHHRGEEKSGRQPSGRPATDASARREASIVRAPRLRRLRRPLPEHRIRHSPIVRGQSHGNSDAVEANA